MVISGTVLDTMTKLVKAVGPLNLNDPLDPGLVFDAGGPLQKALEAVVRNDAMLNPHAFAVVDLTENPLAPVYAGWRDIGGWGDDEKRRIASLAKLLALYGAFKLRANLREISIILNISDLPTLAKGLRKTYQRIGAATETLPLIEDIFEPLTKAGEVNFAKNPSLRDRDLNPIYAHYEIRKEQTYRLLGDLSMLKQQLEDKPKQDRVPFHEHLRLMAGWSDDVSAAVVIQSLGFPYLWALTKGSSLFRRWKPLGVEYLPPREDAVGRSGLFLASDYNGSIWPKPVRAHLGAPVSGTTQGGNARSVAVLMTMLAQDRLVNREGDIGMREMLRMTGPGFTAGDRGEDSPIGTGMAAAGWTAKQLQWDEDLPFIDPAPDTPLAVSKIGLDHKFKNCSNALLVRTNRPSSTITAVLVALNNVNDSDIPLQRFGSKMAEKLDELHS